MLARNMEELGLDVCVISLSWLFIRGFGRAVPIQTVVCGSLLHIFYRAVSLMYWGTLIVHLNVLCWNIVFI